MKWKELGVNRTLLVGIKERENTFFMIVQRKVLKARGTVCYDREGQEPRKSFKPENNAIDMAVSMGIEALNGKTV